MLLKDPADAQLGEGLLQVVGTGNEEPGHVHVDNPAKSQGQG